MQAAIRDGLVVRALGGFLFVHADGRVYRCATRGTLKKRQDIMVGDRVVFVPDGPDKGVVEDRKERINQLVRPPIANVDQVIVVLAVDEPAPNYILTDRILVQAEAAGLRAVLCLNKCDLLKETGRADAILAPYRLAGYACETISTKTGCNLAACRARLCGSVSVLAGQSGVGKSSLLNALRPDLDLGVGQVSQRTWRGRHTTRQVELLSMGPGCWVADTPGFSTMNLPDVEADCLVDFFPELKTAARNCRFPGCRHQSEPDCAVRSAVAAGLASEERYRSYLSMATELREMRRKW